MLLGEAGAAPLRTVPFIASPTFILNHVHNTPPVMIAPLQLFIFASVRSFLCNINIVFDLLSICFPAQ